MIKNKLKLFATILLTTFMIVGCGNNPGDPTGPDKPGDPTEPEDPGEVVDPSTIIFADKTFTYDGTEKKVEIDNLPQGYTARYVGNTAVDSGTYDASVLVTPPNGGNEFVLRAKLTIEKAESVLTAPTEYNSDILSGTVTPTYEVNNNEQTIEVPTYALPGDYTLDLFAPESRNYKESNHIKVNIHISGENVSGVKFASKRMVYDGSKKELVADTTNIKAGYSVTYESNFGTDVGSYYATCHVLKDGTPFGDLHAILDIDYPDYEPFEDYCDQLFLDYLEGDYMSWNLFAEDPANFGYERDPEDKAFFYCYTADLFKGNDYVTEAYEEFSEYYDELKEFLDKPLSKNQMATYRAIDHFFFQEVDLYKPEGHYTPYMEMYYIDQFGGYVSIMNSCMEGYIIRNEQDCIDIIDYIESAPECFESYIIFANEKIAAGYPYSNFTLDECIKFIDDTLNYEGDDYYLIGILQDKIDNSPLSASKKRDYKDAISSAVKNYLEPTYEKFAEDIAKLKGKCPKEKELYTHDYEYGYEIYLNSLKNRIGYHDVTLDGFKEEIKAAATEWANKYFSSGARKLSGREKNFYENIGNQENGTPIIAGLTDPYDMLDFLKEFAKTIVYPLENDPEIVVKHMSEAEQKTSNAVAYYTKSTLDHQGTEYITLNDMALTNYNSALETMGHEGYPGHLYEYVYTKSLGLHPLNGLFTSVAHGEGWATYVSYKLWDYIPTVYDGPYINAVENYCGEEQAYSVFAYLLYTYIDLLGNGLQLDRQTMGKEINNIGINDAIIDDILPLLVEIPGEYASYGFGQYKFIQLHEYAQEALGIYYNEQEFNKAILSEGWCLIERVEELAEEFVARQQFIWGLN